uniref:Cytochrome P450 n=1 Tax=Megaselia scalaris TaxID=36166 RepID=T1H2Z4_MEGSC
MDKDFKTDLNNWALESIAFIALDTRLQCFDEKNKSPDADILINGMHKFFELSYELDKNLLYGDTFRHRNAAREKMKTQPPKAPTEMSILEKLIKIDRKTAVVMAMDMLFAGIDTTSTALTGILLCLAKNQDKQELLRQEVSQIKNNSLTANDMNNLPYLRACIKEGIRMYPVVSANARNISQDIVVGG